MKENEKKLIGVQPTKKIISNERFIQNSLPNVVDNIAEGLHKSKFQVFKCFLEYLKVHND